MARQHHCATLLGTLAMVTTGLRNQPANRLLPTAPMSNRVIPLVPTPRLSEQAGWNEKVPSALFTWSNRHQGPQSVGRRGSRAAICRSHSTQLTRSACLQACLLQVVPAALLSRAVVYVCSQGASGGKRSCQRLLRYSLP